jgi:hypothetical protein
MWREWGDKMNALYVISKISRKKETSKKTKM